MSVKDLIRRLRVCMLKARATRAKQLEVTGRTLIIAPHPDDEVIGCGGLIAHLCNIGNPPQIIILTGGEGSHRGHCDTSNADIVSNRRRLTLQAAKILGLPEDHIHCLDFPDGCVTSEIGSDKHMRLLELIAHIAPDNIFIPHNGEGWPDHIAVKSLIKSLTTEDKEHHRETSVLSEYSVVERQTTDYRDYTDYCSPVLARGKQTTEDTKDTENHKESLCNSVLSESSVVENKTTDYTDYTDYCSPVLAGEDLTTEDTKDTEKHQEDLRGTSVLSEYSVVAKQTTDYSDFNDYRSQQLAGEILTTEDTKDTKKHKVDLRETSVLSESSVVEKQTTDYNDYNDCCSPVLAGGKSTTDYTDYTDCCSPVLAGGKSTTDYTDYTDLGSPSLAGEILTTEDTKDTKEHKNLRDTSVYSVTPVVENEPQRTQRTQRNTKNPGGEDLTTEDTKGTEKHCETSVYSVAPVVENLTTEDTKSTKDLRVPRGEHISVYEYCVWMWYYNVWNLDWKNAFQFKMTLEEHRKKLEAIDAYIKPCAPCGMPWSGELPKVFINANKWNRELYFRIK